MTLLISLENLTPENVNHLKQSVYKEVEGKEVEVNDIKDIATLNLIDNMDDDELSTLLSKKILLIFYKS